MTEHDDLYLVDFLKDFTMTPSEVKWVDSMSTSAAVLIQARERAKTALPWRPLFHVDEINLAVEQDRAETIMAENASQKINCETLLVVRKQRGIDSSQEFIAHEKFQPKHEGTFFFVFWGRKMLIKGFHLFHDAGFAKPKSQISTEAMKWQERDPVFILSMKQKDNAIKLKAAKTIEKELMKQESTSRTDEEKAVFNKKKSTNDKHLVTLVKEQKNMQDDKLRLESFRAVTNSQSIVGLSTDPQGSHLFSSMSVPHISATIPQPTIRQGSDSTPIVPTSPLKASVGLSTDPQGSHLFSSMSMPHISSTVPMPGNKRKAETMTDSQTDALNKCNAPELIDLTTDVLVSAEDLSVTFVKMKVTLKLLLALAELMELACCFLSFFVCAFLDERSTQRQKGNNRTDHLCMWLRLFGASERNGSVFP